MPAKNNGHLEKRASGVDGTSLQDTSRVHLVYLTGRDFRVTRRSPRHSAFCKRAVPISWQRTTPRLVGGEGSDLIWLIWWPARLLITVAFVPPWAPPFFLPTAHAAYRQCWPLAAHRSGPCRLWQSRAASCRCRSAGEAAGGRAGWRYRRLWWVAAPSIPAV